MRTSEEYAKMGLAALRRAAKKARENAATRGLRIPIWRNGHIVYEEQKGESQPMVGADKAGQP